MLTTECFSWDVMAETQEARVTKYLIYSFLQHSRWIRIDAGGHACRGLLQPTAAMSTRLISYPCSAHVDAPHTFDY